MFKKIAFAGLGIALFASPFLASAQSADVQSIINSLLAQVRALQAQLAQLQGQTGGAGAQCVNLSHSIGLDDTDADTDGDVTALQKFLGGRVTGYFGPATMRLVQQWQSSHSLISSGDPESTGYGFVGPKTRSAMACGDVGIITPIKPIPPDPIVIATRLSASPTSGQAPLTVNFTAANLTQGSSYQINFGDGATTIVQAPARDCPAGNDACIGAYVSTTVSHTYTSAGTYTAMLTPDYPCLHTSPRCALDVQPGGTVTITVSGNCTSNCGTPVSFDSEPAYGQAPLTVRFRMQGGNTSSVYTIVPGNGAPNIGIVPGQSVAYTYPNAGTFEARLEENIGGRGNSYQLVGTTMVTVTGTSQPTITVTSPNGGESWIPGQTGTVWWRSVNAPADAYVGRIALYKGGSFLVDLIPLLSRYPASGSFQWPISQTSVTGSDFKIQTILYRDSSGSESVIASDWSDAPFSIASGQQSSSFSAAPTSGAAPLAVAFTANNVAKDATYYINYGDGTDGTMTLNPVSLQACYYGPAGCTLSYSASASHTYASAGTYIATLSESAGCPAGMGCPAYLKTVGTVTITVTGAQTGQAPVITSVSPSQGTVGSQMTITGKGFDAQWNTVTVGTPTGGYAPSTVAASQNGGTLMYLAVPQIGPGAYLVTVYNNTIPGNPASNSLPFTVTSAPSPTFRASPATGVAPLETRFTASDLDPQGSYYVTFGDTVSGPLAMSYAGGQGTVSHTYASAGTYTAQLVRTYPCSSAGVGPCLAPQTVGTATIIVVAGNPPSIKLYSPTSGSTVLSPGDMPLNWASANAPSGSGVAFWLEVQYPDGSFHDFALINDSSGMLYPSSGSGVWHVPPGWTPGPHKLHGYLLNPGSAAGCTSSSCIASSAETPVFNIAAASTPAPTPGFTAWPNSGTAPLNVYLTMTGVSSPSSYSVNFGDGASSSSWQADTEAASTYFTSHSYASAGTYTAALMYQPPSPPCNAPPGAACMMVMPAPVQVGTATITVSSCGPGGCSYPVPPSTYPTTQASAGSTVNLANSLAALEAALKALVGMF